MWSARSRRWQALLLLSVCTGCAAGSRGDVDLLEARLRDQQDLTARYERIIDAHARELEVARRESELLRTQLADQNLQPLLPEHADVLLRAEKLAFHPLMTGTRDVDGAPGDDRLLVVLTPQAHSGETIRLVGGLEIEALDLTRSHDQQRIARWTFTPAEARDLWHNGFLASGFQLDLPWEDSAAGEIVLHARLLAPDGRQLDASHQVRVNSTLAKQNRTSPATVHVEPRLAPPASSLTASPVSFSSRTGEPRAFPGPVGSGPTGGVIPTQGHERPAPRMVPPPASGSTPLAPGSLGPTLAAPQLPPTSLPVVQPGEPHSAGRAHQPVVPSFPTAAGTTPLESQGIHISPRAAAGGAVQNTGPESTGGTQPPSPGAPGSSPGPLAPADGPPPFPATPPAVQSSDNWTDASIPYLR